MSTTLDYNAAADPSVRQAVSRAVWSVIQTGLITTALALFGVFVLASRVNNINAMDFYSPAWFPLGAWSVGTVAGSGYVVASWWTGLRVRGWLLLGVAALQLVGYVGAHYAEYATLDLVYRDSHEAVGFFSYFHYATISLALGPHGFRDGEVPLGTWGYAVRGVEAAAFATVVIAAALVLVRRPRCDGCGGTPERRRLAVVPPAHLRHAVAAVECFARGGDVDKLTHALRAHERPATEPPADADCDLVLTRCGVCGIGHVDTVTRAEANGSPSVPRAADGPMTVAAGATVAADAMVAAGATDASHTAASRPTALGGAITPVAAGSPSAAAARIGHSANGSPAVRVEIRPQFAQRLGGDPRDPSVA